MRFFILCASALFFAVSFGDEAQAKRGGIAWGTSEQMSFVAPTDIQDDSGQPMALCHLTKKTHVLFAGIWRSSKGYVLATNACDSDSYYSLPADKVTLGKESGDFPKDLPNQPVMSFDDMLSGFWGLGVIGALLILAAVRAARSTKRKNLRVAEMGVASPAAIKALDAMCHAAKADGKLDDAEITMMADIARQMTGETFEADRIRRMFELAEAKPTDAQFAAFGKGLSPKQKRQVLQATLMIIGSDGDLDKSEMAFVQKLAAGLSIKADEVRAMFQAMTADPA